MDAAQETNDFDTAKAPIIADSIIDELKIGERGFLAVLKEGTVTASTRKELRKKLASLAANEAFTAGAEPIEIYRVTRLPLARKVDFKF